MKNKYRKAMSNIIHDTAIYELKLANVETNDKVLTYNSILYLDIISAKNGEYTASNIADLLQVSRPSVTQKINELESAGYITKSQSDKDKRVFYLSVTDKYDTIYDSLLGEKFDIDGELISLLRSKHSEIEVDKFFDMLEETSSFYASVLSKLKYKVI